MKGIITWIAYSIIATTITALFFLRLSTYCNSITLDNIVIGIYASGLVVILTQLILKIRMYSNYHHLQGNWDEHKLEGRNLTKILGYGTIKYIKDNVLSIKLTHNQRTWRGQIIMSKDYPHTGHIVWHYDTTTENEHEFGLKELLVPTERNMLDNKYDYLYLLGINYAQKMTGRIEKYNQHHKVILNDVGYGKVVWVREKRINKRKKSKV